MLRYYRIHHLFLQGLLLHVTKHGLDINVPPNMDLLLLNLPHPLLLPFHSWKLPNQALLPLIFAPSREPMPAL